MVHTDESLIHIYLTRYELMCLEPVSSSRFGMDEQRGKSKVEFVCVCMVSISLKGPGWKMV